MPFERVVAREMTSWSLSEGRVVSAWAYSQERLRRVDVAVATRSADLAETTCNLIQSWT
jgi:hypothetical protein